MPLDPNASRKILGDALSALKKQAPTADGTATLISHRDANTRFGRSEITSTGEVEAATLHFTVALGKRHVTLQSNQTDNASLQKMAENGVRLAALSPEDPEWLEPLGPQQYLTPPATAYDEETSRLKAEERAKAAATAITSAAKNQLEVAGFYAHDATAQAIQTTRGLFAYYRRTLAQFRTTARTADGTGAGFSVGASNRAAQLDIQSISDIAADKALRSARPRRLEPGRYTVVLEPLAVAELLGFLVAALDARRADEGRSFFARKEGGTRVGDKLFSDLISLSSDPSSKDTPASPFAVDGLPLEKTHWIDKGQLNALTYTRYWAQKQGKKPTGRPSAWQLQGGTAKSTAELVQGVKRGVLITRFWYTRWVDPQAILITGLTRDGTFLIENGQVVGAVNNFRFNESPVTLLKNADALSETSQFLTNLESAPAIWRVPAVRSHDFNLASISEAV